ncbi:TIGR02117 family protein [Botryobacter ruber]|uniref:TIGR02117 family protein n=1 Tax=Botryobacter ruber TaxID=2171629 RepID=UPI000E0A55CA|nr:TIGR02117 family protein [Botryobacter ruber]
MKKEFMHQVLKQLLKRIFQFLGSLFLLGCLFLLLALVLSSIPVNKSFAQTDTSDVQIFVTDNGVHTDIVVPVRTALLDWRTRLPLDQYADADSSYTHVGFGWGDRRFYMKTPEWKDLRPGVFVTALFWPTRSAMHVHYVPRPLTVNKYQRPVQLSQEQYRQLVAFLQQSFQQQDGEFILIPGAGYSGEDNFYEAHGRFYILRNCNNWTNRGLKEAGVKTAFWAPIPYAIMRHLR